VASAHHPIHLVEVARFGADVVTMPPAVLRLLLSHPLTECGLAASIANPVKTGQYEP
jgi:transaldolase